jgi:hypothetical protein
MTRPPFWDDDPDAWDTLIVAGDNGPIRAPGLVDEIDVSIKNKVDKHPGPGIDGGTITVQGEDVPEVKVVLKIWEKSHQIQLEKFLNTIRPQGKKATIKPRDFTHPILSEHGIKSLIYESIQGPGMPDKQGFRKITLQFSRFKLPPKQSVATTPKQSVASVFSTTPYSDLYGPPPPPGGVVFDASPVQYGPPPPPPKSPSQRGSKP